MKSLTLALLSALSLGCGVVVSPDGGASDAGLLDSTVRDSGLAPDVSPGQDARADVLADSPTADAGPRRPRSIVRISNDEAARPPVIIQFPVRGAELPTDPPEVAGGCWVIAERLTNLVSAGTVTARWNAESLTLSPEPLANNEYRARHNVGIASGTLVTVSGSGSEAFPAFSVSCSMPEAMPMINEPPAAADATWNSSETLLVRWAPTAGSDLVRVSIRGTDTARAASLTIHCLGPISRGILAIPSAALQQIDAFPNARVMSASRVRTGTTSVGNTTIDAWCSQGAPYLRQFTR